MFWTIFFVLAAIIVTTAVYYYLRILQQEKTSETTQPYTEGLNFLLAGDIQKAKERLNEAVRRDTENIDAYLKLGAIMRQSGQLSSAIKIHQSLTIRSDLKESKKTEIYKELALDYEQAGSLQKAAGYTDKLLALDGSNRWAIPFRIRLAEQLNDWQTAFNLTKKHTSILKNAEPFKLALYRVEEGRVLMKDGREKEGRVKCREALKLDHTCAPAFLTLAQSYIKEEREEDALKEVKLLLETNPDQGYLAYELMENLYFNLGRFDEIETIYREILSERPADLPAAKALARFLRKKGEVERVLKVCQDALNYHPEDLWMRRFMIRTLLEANRLNEIGPLALELLDRIFEEQTHYTCSKCGYRTEETLWRCPDCGYFGTFDL